MFKRVIVVFSIISIFLFSSQSLVVQASAMGYKNENMLDVISGYEMIRMVEEKGVDVVSTLINMKKEYEDELLTVGNNSVQANDIQAQIMELESNINIISEFKRINENIDFLDKLESSAVVNSIIIPDPCLSFILAKIAIVAWFQSNNYKLSAELLNYSFVNKSLNKRYTPNPINTNQILSSQWFEDHKNLTSSGSGVFSTGDLKYSIHLFNYYFGYDFDIYKYLVIEDVYDFASGDQSYPEIAGIANNAMYLAQRVGCLVPFKTTIYLPTN